MTGKRGNAPPAPAGTRRRSAGILVCYHAEAVEEYEAIRDRDQRRGILTAVGHLRRVGRKLGMPHARPVHGAAKLRELRPRGGQSVIRPLYAEIDGEFVILCIAPEAQADPSGFRRGVERAQRRAREDHGLEV